MRSGLVEPSLDKVEEIDVVFGKVGGMCVGGLCRELHAAFQVALIAVCPE